MKYIRSLDGVRAIAILLVMLFHFFFALNNDWFSFGWIGVQLFFVLSGYLITSILFQTRELEFGAYTKRFYFRRILRIFPLYYFYVLLAALSFFLIGKPQTFQTVIGYIATYTYNLLPLISGELHFDGYFTHFWSLAIEEQFYLFWPFIVYFLPLRYFRVLIILIILLIPGLRLLLQNMLMDNPEMTDFLAGETIYRFTFSQVDAFAFGALIPAFKLDSSKAATPVLPVATTGIALLVGIGMALLNPAELPLLSLGYHLGVLSNYQQVWSYTLIDLASLGIILYLVSLARTQKETPFSKLMESRILVAIGKISYGMYVYHWVILSALRDPVIKKFPVALTLPMYCILVYAVSYVSYLFIEKKFLKIKDHVRV